MRARSVLLSWLLLHLWLGLSLVLSALRARSALTFWLDLAYGLGFLLSALLCLIAVLFWSKRMQRRVSIRLIRLARLAALGASFCVMLALVAIEIIVALFLGGNLLTVGFVGGLALMEYLSINEADLTPARESYIWHTAKTR